MKETKSPTAQIRVDDPPSTNQEARSRDEAAQEPSVSPVFPQPSSSFIQALDTDISSRTAPIRGGPSLVVVGHSLALLDAFALFFSAWLTMTLSGVSAASGDSSASLFSVVPLTLAMTYLGFAISGLYSPELMVRVARQSVTILIVWCCVSVLTMLIAIPTYNGPLVTLASWQFIAPLVIVGGRLVVSLAVRIGLAYGKFGQRIALIGTQKDIELARQFIKRDRLVRPVLTITADNGTDELQRGLEQISIATRQEKLDSTVVLVPAPNVGVNFEHCLDFLSGSAIRIALLPIPVLRAWSGKNDFDLERTIVAISERPIRGWGRILKSALDKFGALFGLVVFSPIMLATALAIKLESPGPVFFMQRRHGLNGRVFKVIKFRSMTVCEDGKYIKQAQQNDIRVTRVGRFIRNTSFDELPQFINVLRGDMSMVGPRPHALAHDELYIPLIPTYRQRFRVKPGITGWAQINGLRGETKTLQEMADRIEYDIDYTRRWWIGLDIWILIKTLFVGFVSKRTY